MPLVKLASGFSFHTPDLNLLGAQEEKPATFFPSATPNLASFFSQNTRVSSVSAGGFEATPAAPIPRPIAPNPAPAPNIVLAKFVQEKPLTRTLQSPPAPIQPIAPNFPLTPAPAPGVLPIPRPVPQVFKSKNPTFVPQSIGGSIVSSALFLPGAAIAVRGAASIMRAGIKVPQGAFGGLPGIGGMSGGGILRGVLTGMGVESVLDLFGLGLFGSEPENADVLSDLIEEMVESGYINTPGVRKDGTHGANNWLHWNLDDNSARPFLSSEYISRNFVQAVRRNERTPRYRSKPRPAGRSRRGG